MLYNKRQDLCSSEHEYEILYRTVVNRAYYGSYLIAREQPGLRDLGHDQLVKRLIGNKKTSTIGNRLKQLKRSRHDADYYPERKIILRDAEKALAIARKVISDLDLLCG